jgi:hypothetical protein
MRSLKSGLVGVAVAGLCGVIAVVGCSADGSAADLGEDPSEAGTAETSPSPLPSSSSSSGGDDTPKVDAGKNKDSGAPPPEKTDAGKDSGPPAPSEGDACPQPNQIFKRSCALCGTQEAVCLVPEDGGPSYVSPYGQCENQVADGCEPGTQEEVPCGDCGTLKRTCTKFCTWSTTGCQNQPLQHCTPGTLELVSAGCPADKYRQKTCKASCTWDNISTTCADPPSNVLVPSAVGATNSTIAVLRSTHTTTRLPLNDCPIPSISSTITPYVYIEVRNPNPKAVTVSIYNSQASATSPVIDTVMAAYDGATIPTTDAERKNCIEGVGDNGTTTLTGNINFASLDGAKAVTIPAGGSVQVYFAAYPPYDPDSPTSSTGMIKLNVKTESFAP